MNSLMKISGNHSFSAAMWSLLMPYIPVGSTWWMNCTRSYLAPRTMPSCAFTSRMTDRIKMLTQVEMLWLMTEQKPFCQTLPDNRIYSMLVKAWKTDSESLLFLEAAAAGREWGREEILPCGARLFLSSSPWLFSGNSAMNVDLNRP